MTAMHRRLSLLLFDIAIVLACILLCVRPPPCIVRYLTAGQRGEDEDLDEAAARLCAKEAPKHFAELASALAGLGVGKNKLRGLWRALAGVLHLGQITCVVFF